MIVSFGDRATADLFHGVRSHRIRRFPANIVEAALVKLDVLNAAQLLGDLRSPPGNHLEALRGDLRGFYSIRINNQWRIFSRWQTSEAHEVRLVDYH
jgi:proteic killer suppression protein